MLTSNIIKRNCVHSAEVIQNLIRDRHLIDIIATLPRSLPENNRYLLVVKSPLVRLGVDLASCSNIRESEEPGQSQVTRYIHCMEDLCRVVRFLEMQGKTTVLRVSSFINGSNICPFHNIAIYLCFNSYIPLPHPKLMYQVNTEDATNNELICKASSFPWKFTSKRSSLETTTCCLSFNTF